MSRTMKLMTLAALLFSATPSFAGQTAGTLTHPKATVVLKYAYLITGPDTFDPKKTIRRVVLTPSDVGPQIQACAALDCIDGQLKEGLIADLVGGPRINYWMVLNGGTIQNSGTLDPSVLKTTADQPKDLAGKLTFDDSGMGGPKVDVTFDAAMVKAFTK